MVTTRLAKNQRPRCDPGPPTNSDWIGSVAGHDRRAELVVQANAADPHLVALPEPDVGARVEPRKRRVLPIQDIHIENFGFQAPAAAEGPLGAEPSGPAIAPIRKGGVPGNGEIVVE